MNTMREQLFSKLGEKLAGRIGEASVKISDKAIEECIMYGLYEPKIPAEMLKNNMDK